MEKRELPKYYEDCVCRSFCDLFSTKHCNVRCIKNMEMTHLLSVSGIPVSRRVVLPLIDSDEDKDVNDAIRRVSEDIENIIADGTNIILYSEKTGNGKTTIAINLMISYFNSIWAGNGFRSRGYFMYVPSYINRCKDNISKFDAALTELKSRVKNDDLLVLDDVGATRMSEYDMSVLSSIVNDRLLAKKSIIATTNCDRNTLSSVIGERMTDRLWSTSAVFHLKSDSLRGIIS